MGRQFVRHSTVHVHGRPGVCCRASRFEARCGWCSEPAEPPVRNGTQASVEPQQGDYILVKRGRTYAVGQVDHIDENHELAVKFLTPLKNITFVWPAQQDMEAMDYSEVVEILEPPKKLKKKGCPLRFPFNFSEFLPLC
ncbi:Biotin synthase [Frankliniella fusca]|uniref:Biotin synthase n=1 Tax=Frankliniella fusca TaxID=407009 RepID=A0AAE1LMM7_9NEOP|nr:Biotin synthase [Frankliniella fusca]KAK3925025.1 Biotin synthase [Frankliniella fusca]